MTDISMDLGGYRINLRVGAIVSRGDNVLICRARTENWWYLPGGRVKVHENSREAITRELREEIGDQFRILRPIVCAENFFGLDGVSFHEVCTFYEAEWLGGDEIIGLEGADEVFAWIPRTGVTAIDLKPHLIKRYITNPPQTLELVINREGPQSNRNNETGHSL